MLPRTIGMSCFIAFVSSLTLFSHQAKSEEPISISKQGAFFVGGDYIDKEKGVMAGQMYVQYQIPAEIKHPYPVIMIHGGNQTGINYIETPDGREGWGTYFLRQGRPVYIVDQIGRGRSNYIEEAYGKSLLKPTAKRQSERFTAPESVKEFPQASKHTQWPGSTGQMGDPVFDQFYATQVQMIADLEVVERVNRKALSALLDKIGPSILLTHSQSGPIGWGVADDRSELVKGILSLEPSGPPLLDVNPVGEPNNFKELPPSRPYGLTKTPLTYDPPVASADELTIARDAGPADETVVTCYNQAGTPRKLAHLANIPILVVAAEASYHSTYDHCTVNYLKTAGVSVDYVPLAEAGIRGNGHMVMIEKNSADIAALLNEWLVQRGL